MITKIEATPRDELSWWESGYTTWTAMKINDQECNPLRVTIKVSDDGLPSLVYIEGSSPLFDTWVLHEGEVIGVTKGKAYS